MSVTDPTPDEPDREAPPEFDLDYRYDDTEDPAEVTVFPAIDAADLTTEWITAATADTVSIEEIR